MSGQAEMTRPLSVSAVTHRRERPPGFICRCLGEFLLAVVPDGPSRGPCRFRTGPPLVSGSSPPSSATRESHSSNENICLIDSGQWGRNDPPTCRRRPRDVAELLGRSRASRTSALLCTNHDTSKVTKQDLHGLGERSSSIRSNILSLIWGRGHVS